MKLRTEIDFDPVTPFLHIPGDPKECCIDDVCKDAMAAHALMQAMESFKSGEGYIDDEWLDALKKRADELLHEWGFE